MGFFVIDTNVPVVANARNEHSDPGCILECINILENIREHEIIILDDTLLILHEYMAHLNMSGQPGAGDLFMKWLWSVQANEDHCKLVRITPDKDDQANFAEFPKSIKLKNFDPSDRKFVAVALASGN